MTRAEIREKRVFVAEKIAWWHDQRRRWAWSAASCPVGVAIVAGLYYWLEAPLWVLWAHVLIGLFGIGLTIYGAVNAGKGLRLCLEWDEKLVELLR